MIRYLRLMQTTSSEVMEHTPLCEESWWKGQGMYSCRAVKHLRSINNHHEISSPFWVVVGIAIYQQGKKNTINNITILWCIIHSTTLLKSCKDLIMSHTRLVLVLSLFFLFLPHATVHFIYVFLLIFNFRNSMSYSLFLFFQLLQKNCITLSLTLPICS